MNDVLKVGIIWIIISSILVYILKPTVVRSFVVGTIGVILVIVGFIINEYQVYRFEKQKG